MSQCTDVDAALKRLEGKIDDQNRRIAALEADAKRNGNNNNNSKTPPPTKPYDDTELRNRIGVLEKNMEVIKIFVGNCLNNFADIENFQSEVFSAFQEMFELISPLLDWISSVFNFFK